MYLSGSTSVFGIIGNPIQHSFSPAMQTIAFQHCDYNAIYVPFLVTKENISLALQSMQVLNIQGANITSPYKKNVFNLLTKVSEQAKVLESVNVIHFTENDWRGYSTDGDGFIEGLKEINYHPHQTKIQVIGAGGAAESIIYSLAKNQPTKIYIENRTFSKVHNIIQKYKPLFPQVEFIGGSSKEKIDLLVNTTSIGTSDNTLSVPLEIIKQAKIVVDIIYSQETALLQKSKELGKIVQDGIPMLLYQGALSFEIWTKQKAPIEIMRNCLKQIHSTKK